MNLAILQLAADGRSQVFPYRDDVALLGAVLRARHHSVALVLLQAPGNAGGSSRGAGGLSANDRDLAATLSALNPEMVLVYVESLAADATFRIAGLLAQMHGVPLIPFGPHASLKPDDCLSLPGAEAVAVGPADHAIPLYLALRQKTLAHLRTPGLWVKCETGVMRNPVPPPPESLDLDPAPARDLYPFEKLIDPAGFIPVRVSRGGEGGAIAPAAASMVAQATWPPTASWPVFHRPVAKVIEEMRRVADEHFDLVGLRVGGDRWLSRPAWVREFADAYVRQVGLPLRTTLYAPDVTPEAAALLARLGCDEARVPVGSGSALIRNDVLGLNFPDAAAEAAFAALRAAGVPSVAAVEVGAAYETPATIQQTVEFLKRLQPTRVEADLHFPAPGTPADKVARENGWLVSDPAGEHRAGRPAVTLPRLGPEDLVTACEVLPYAVLRPMTAHLIRLARRVRMGSRGTLHELAVKPFLTPARRKKP
jgi:anaerobic magnesium-protoporphyrin IX monomethyl ester cyclase